VIRRVVVGLLSVVFLIAVALAQEPAGDDPPVRLKKKVRPDAAEKAKEEPPKPAEPPRDEPKEKEKEKAKEAKEPKEGDEPPAAEQPETDEAEVLNRVGKNMRTSEDRLANRELTDATRQVQEDILKDLDALINQQKNGGGNDQNQNQNEQQNQQQNDGAKKDGQQKQDGKTKVGMGAKRRGLKGQQQARGQGQQRGQAQAGRQPGAQGQQQANAGQPQGQKPQGQQANPANQGGGGQSQGEPTKLAEMYKDVWGTLPETMRAEMNAYSREQFMAKYNDLIKQYYSTVAEKSRKKE
jgi:hypothetical protein